MYRLVLTELLKSSSWTVSLKVKDLRSAVVARLISKQVSSIQQDFCSQKQIRHQKSRKLQKSSAGDSYLKVTSLRIRGRKTWVYIWTFSWSVYCSLKPEMVSVEGKLGGQVRQTTEEWTEGLTMRARSPNETFLAQMFISMYRQERGTAVTQVEVCRGSRPVEFIRPPSITTTKHTFLCYYLIAT